jgi:hypothetical protein
MEYLTLAASVRCRNKKTPAIGSSLAELTEKGD